MATKVAGAGTKEKPWKLKTPSGSSEYVMYKAEDADPIMIDFWLSNAKLQGEGGTFRVRYTVDGGEAKFIDKWDPIWLSGWITGKHQVKLELVDKDGNVVENGGYNSTTREITVTR